MHHLINFLGGYQNNNKYVLLIISIIAIITLCFAPIENWGITILALLVFIALFNLLEFGSILSGALIACVFQWLQSSMDIFRANLTGVSVNTLTGLPYSADACFLSLLGVLIFSVGVRFSYGLRPLSRFYSVTDLVLWLSPRKLAITSLLAFIISLIKPLFMRLLPGLSQFFLVIDVFREASFLLLAFTVFSTKKGYIWLFTLFSISIGSGFVSYFSTFKFSFYWLILALISSRSIFQKDSKVIWLPFLLTVTLTVGLYWTAVKPEYRAFLNQGASHQLVKTSPKESLAFLLDLASQKNPKDLVEASDKLSERVGYTRFFALVIDRELHGLNPKDEIIWWNALKHILLPRILYPDKPALDDSAQTNLYTGLGVAGANQGTSISIGYIAESYIDFGEIGMFIPIFLLGCLYGQVFKLLTSAKFLQPLGFACACVIFVIAGGAVETSAVKHLGGLIVRCISSMLILKFLGRKIMVFLYDSSRQIYHSSYFMED